MLTPQHSRNLRTTVKFNTLKFICFKIDCCVANIHENAHQQQLRVVVLVVAAGPDESNIGHKLINEDRRESDSNLKPDPSNQFSHPQKM